MSEWFRSLFGFSETTQDAVRAQLVLDGERLTSTVTGESWSVGRFGTPSLGELRARVASLAPEGPTTLRHEAVADVLVLHARPSEEGALFQAASQFNCLEFGSPQVIPEAGVTGYASDPTQGPACALAAAPAALWRHLYVPLEGGIGQTKNRQIDNLAGVAARLALDPPGWIVKNGYVDSTPAALARVDAALDAADRDDVLATLRIGVSSRVEVVFEGRFRRVEGRRPHVSQAWCSALSCGYSGAPRAAWARLARVVLDATYEATLLAAAVDRAEGRGSGRVWLTFVGGGVFANDPAWIHGAIGRAVRRADRLGLDIRLAHFGRVLPEVAAAVDRAVDTA
jgi:hypothetical protein